MARIRAAPEAAQFVVEFGGNLHCGRRGMRGARSAAAIVSSRPSSTIISNRPGLAVRPVSATRDRMDERAGLNTPLRCRSSHRAFHMWFVERDLPRASASASAAIWLAHLGCRKNASRAHQLRTRPLRHRSGRACSTKSVSRLTRGRSSSSSRSKATSIAARAGCRRDQPPRARAARARQAAPPACATGTARSSSPASRC